MCGQNPTEVHYIKIKDTNLSSNPVQEIKGEIVVSRFVLRKSQIEQDHNPSDHEIWVSLVFTLAGHFLLMLEREKFEYFAKDIQKSSWNLANVEIPEKSSQPVQRECNISKENIFLIWTCNLQTEKDFWVAGGHRDHEMTVFNS